LVAVVTVRIAISICSQKQVHRYRCDTACGLGAGLSQVEGLRG